MLGETFSAKVASVMFFFFLLIIFVCRFNVPESSSPVQYYIWEDNEAVIRTIIEGRNPISRHVSRTHRIGLVWLERITLNHSNLHQTMCAQQNAWLIF